MPTRKAPGTPAVRKAPPRKGSSKQRHARDNNAVYASFIRICTIVDTLMGNMHRTRQVTANSLATSLEVNPRTIKRDIEFMKEKMDAPIEWDASYGTYVLTSDYSLPVNRRHIGGAAVRPEVVIQPTIDGEIPRFVTTPQQCSDAMQKAFCNLVLATRDHCEVRLLYKRLGDEEGERRHLRPLHLANLDHNWMLIAYDCGRKALRQFRIDRMSGVRIQDTTFTPPAGFDARAYIRNCMGGFGGDATYDLEIRIAPILVPYFNGNKWNDSQTVTALPDGSAILRLRSNNYEASRRKILELGALAVVTAPADFRDRLAREIDAMATLYKSKASVPLASVPR